MFWGCDSQCASNFNVVVAVRVAFDPTHAVSTSYATTLRKRLSPFPALLATLTCSKGLTNCFLPEFIGAWSIADLQHFAASQQQGTTSVTLSPAPSLDGQAGSPQEHRSATNGVHSSSASSSNGSAGHNSDDSEYDSVGESPERSPVNQSTGSLSPPPRPASSILHHGAQQLTLNGSNQHHHHQSTHHGNSNGSTSATASTATSSSNKSSNFTQGGKLANNSNNGDGGEYNNSMFPTIIQCT